MAPCLSVHAMNEFLILAFLFAAGCLLGWCIEVLFRRLSPQNKTRQWINPGFLTGPYLPLYGFGLCTLYLLAGLEAFIPVESTGIRKLLLFAVMAVAMTLLEYIAGLIFIKRLHIQLWDYSGMWLNLDGIICPLFSLFWALLGAAYYFFIHPYILDALAWFSENLAFSFFIGMFYGVFLIDLCYSFRLVARIKSFAEENKLLFRYDEFKAHVRQKTIEQKERYKFIFALGEHARLSENLRSFLEKQRENNRLTALKAKIEQRKNSRF